MVPGGTRVIYWPAIAEENGRLFGAHAATKPGQSADRAATLVTTASKALPSLLHFLLHSLALGTKLQALKKKKNLIQ